MIVSSVLVGLSTLMFGFSVSFSMAVIARFLSGISNGECVKMMSRGTETEILGD